MTTTPLLLLLFKFIIISLRILHGPQSTTPKSTMTQIILGFLCKSSQTGETDQSGPYFPSVTIQSGRKCVYDIYDLQNFNETFIYCPNIRDKDGHTILSNSRDSELVLLKVHFKCWVFSDKSSAKGPSRIYHTVLDKMQLLPTSQDIVDTMFKVDKGKCPVEGGSKSVSSKKLKVDTMDAGDLMRPSMKSQNSNPNYMAHATYRPQVELELLKLGKALHQMINLMLRFCQQVMITLIAIQYPIVPERECLTFQSQTG
ncbi:hypothetical protein C8J56DRAFT_886185 [Mycena floridula]|nr:hypothetical protein C8J56DRAFT_886185 [Mycena floridula]